MYKVNAMTHTVRLSSPEVRYNRFQLKVHSLFTTTTNWYFGWLVSYGRWLQVQGSTVFKRLTTAIITHIIKFLNKSFLKRFPKSSKVVTSEEFSSLCSNLSFCAKLIVLRSQLVEPRRIYLCHITHVLLRSLKYFMVNNPLRWCFSI